MDRDNSVLMSCKFCATNEQNKAHSICKKAGIKIEIVFSRTLKFVNHFCYPFHCFK